MGIEHGFNPFFCVISGAEKTDGLLGIPQIQSVYL
jgi:hypothetical protein